jgi:hypothetical protein
VDRRFANSLYVTMQILLHFAKIILDFTHASNTFFRAARTSRKVFSELECLSCLGA